MPRRSVPEKAVVRYEAPALEKGLDIVELLAERPDGLSQIEIARALDRTVGEIFRMLMALVRRGYIAIQPASDRYILTLKLFELAHKNAPLDRLPKEAVPFMHALAAEIGQSCHLAVVEDGHGVVIAQADSPGPIGFAVRVGTVINLLTSASGRVLLAFSPPERRERLTEAARSAPGFAARHAAGVPHLARIRGRGFEEMESARIRGIHDISFPILDHQGAAIAALTVPFIERVDDPGKGAMDAARATIGRIAGELTAALGGRAANAAAPPLTPRAAAKRKAT